MCGRAIVCVSMGSRLVEADLAGGAPSLVSALLNSDVFRKPLAQFAHTLAQTRRADDYRVVTHSSVSPTDPARPLPATGRLGFVSAYFHLFGIAAVLATGSIAAGIVFPSYLEWKTEPTNKFVALAGAVMLTFGFFRTSWLLDRRRKAGASLALLCFALPLSAYLTGAVASRLSIGIAGCGVILVASVWRHLE